ncbi:MAG: cation diffusion facilitator family transporter [Verrucomicrobiales bacterium]|nr:cation diffusion facilitator family transporter [Verrucomicrobiales bacterium]
MEGIKSRSQEEHAQLMFAMRISLALGVVMLVFKGAGAWYSESVAVMSDAAESVVHIVAVGFAYFSLKLSFKPADETHPYGHAKIAFFSSGVEGALITAAALFVSFEAVKDLIREPRISRPDVGLWFTGVVVVLTGVVGLYLLKTGKKQRSIVLEANGQHVLADCYTSLGVIIGLVLTWVTGWKYWDPICAGAVGLNMAWVGLHLMSRSVHGLMDRVEPKVKLELEQILDKETRLHEMEFHKLRVRDLGDSLWAEVHLLFPEGMLLRDAHALATEIEQAVAEACLGDVHLTTHLESIEDHDAVHSSHHVEG